MKIEAIDHINIVVSDIAAAEKFFVNLLGFEVEHRDDNLGGAKIEKVVGLDKVSAEYVRLGLPEQATKLELIRYIAPIGAPIISNQANDLGMRHIAFKVRDIEKIRERLEKSGVQFFSQIQEYGSSKKLCYLRGPEGIILELAEYNS